jgi:aspartyl-tRNA(Asn)/glutamyl-tRNA(Gln) amidotransferase subunit A
VQPLAPPPYSLRLTSEALRSGDVTAVELTEQAIAAHEQKGDRYAAYKHFDPKGARADARVADARLSAGNAPPLCGIPLSVKDVYGVEGMPTFAGSARQLPSEEWSRDAWLVAEARAAGAVIMGKTHTVEFAYGGVGYNPHWGTPWNPWDPKQRRIPGGSSCGAGASLWEESAMVALGTDTGGSIRIPAAFNGLVGHKTTRGWWPTDGMVPLSRTFDTAGALTRTVEDSIWFYGSVDVRWGDPAALLDECERTSLEGVRIGVPECTLWEDCQSDIGSVLTRTLDEIERAGASVERVVAPIIDDAVELYLGGGIGKAEFNAFLQSQLPEWPSLLHPTVGDRIAGAFPLTSDKYRQALGKQKRMAVYAHHLFVDADILVLPANLITPPPVRAVADDLANYIEVNLATLRPTCPVNLLELCAVTVPVGLDASGMPVGLQFIGQAGEDEDVLAVALAFERTLGTSAERLGRPEAPRRG